MAATDVHVTLALSQGSALSVEFVIVVPDSFTGNNIAAALVYVTAYLLGFNVTMPVRLGSVPLLPACSADSSNTNNRVKLALAPYAPDASVSFSTAVCGRT